MKNGEIYVGCLNHLLKKLEKFILKYIEHLFATLKFIEYENKTNEGNKNKNNY